MNKKLQTQNIVQTEVEICPCNFPPLQVATFSGTTQTALVTPLDTISV